MSNNGNDIYTNDFEQLLL